MRPSRLYRVCGLVLFPLLICGSVHGQTRRASQSADGVFRVGGIQSFVLNSGINRIDSAAQMGLLWGPGSAAMPNYIGRAGGLPAGTDLNPGWSADSGFIAGTVTQGLSILGGYDSVLNSTGSTIVNSNHSMISYNSDGHSTIIGNSYNWIGGSAGRALIVGARQSSVQGGTFNAIVGGDNNDITSTGLYNTIINGTGSTISGTAPGAVILGGARNTNTKRAAVLVGEDGVAYSPGALHIAHTKLTEAGDAQSITVVGAARTTDDTATNLLGVGTDLLALPAGKTSAGTARILLIGVRDGSADGNNDGDYTQVSYVVELGFWWNGTNGFLFKTGTQTAVTTAPTLDMDLISQTNNDFTVGAAPHIAINTGALRPKVTGSAGVIINWVARIDLVMTVVS